MTGMPRDERREADAELSAIAADLAWVMGHHGGRAAMVRCYVDRTGEAHVACNLYTGDDAARGRVGPAVEFRRRLEDLT